MCSARKWAVAAASGVLGFAVVWGGPIHAQQRTAWDGVFQAAQAERGQASYAAACAACHGPDLVSTDPEAPALTDFSFTLQWVGKTIGERFERIRTTMPLGAGGNLSDQEYLDILAFVLSFNGYPAGAAELTPMSDLEVAITRAR